MGMTSTRGDDSINQNALRFLAWRERAEKEEGKRERVKEDKRALPEGEREKARYLVSFVK